MRGTLRGAVAVALLIAVGGRALPAGGDKDRPAPEVGARIEGTVRTRSAGAAFPVRGAVVHSYEVATGKLRSSEPVGDNGAFRLSGLPHGWYELAVEVDGVTYLASRALDLAPDDVRPIELVLEPIAADAQVGRFAGTGREATGIARLERQVTTKEFWFGPKGIAILGSVGAAALIGAAIASGDDETLASPSAP